jgi:arsenite methyltransferase
MTTESQGSGSAASLGGTIGSLTELAALRDTVRERYGAAAQRVSDGSTTGGASSCCGAAEGSSGCCGATTESWDPITANLYDEGQAAGLPAEALLASLGCGNPTALADLEAGDVVLDLGSGGGIDVLLSAKRVGPTGKAYGLDMTDEMLVLANANKARAGATNVEFLRGHIEQIPLPSNTVDVIISNCVVNLSGDKRAVLAESFRVLKPGGRFAVSDVVVRGEVPADLKRSMELWVGCVAGALEEQEFLTLLYEVGFVDASIEPTRVYKAEDAAGFLAGTGLDMAKFAAEIDGKFMGAFVRATKPGVREARPVRRALEGANAVVPAAAVLAAASAPAAVSETKACCGPDCCA